MFDRSPFIKLQEKELVFNNSLLAIVDDVDRVDEAGKNYPKDIYLKKINRLIKKGCMQ